MFETRTRKKDSHIGAAVTEARDAYRGVPVLKQPTWNYEIAAYFFLGGVSAGAALIGSLAEVFGGERRKSLARAAHYVSFATLVPCPFLLIDDLGRPSRFHHMLRVFKPSSPMNLGSWALTAHGAGATVTILSMLARDGKLPVLGPLLRLLPERALAALGMPSSFVLAGYTGVLLGTTSVPVWHTSPLLGAVFMASSMSTGAAATGLAALVFGHGDDSQQEALSLMALTCVAAELGTLAAYVGTSGASARPLLKGSGLLLSGSAAAALVATCAAEVTNLRSHRSNAALRALAGLCGLVGGALLRWAIVRAGRESAADREGTLATMKSSRERPGWVPARMQAEGQ